MSENPTPTPPGGDGAESAPVAPPPPKRGPGHRGQDIRDTMAEMAAKAHEISLEAGSRMAATMREVIGAAAGISAFAIESARDLVNYMVRRGQMSQDEANKLMREVEEAHASRPKVETPRKPDPGALKPAPKVESPKTIVADTKPAPAKAAAPAPAKVAAPAPAKTAAPAPAKAAAPAPAKAAAPAPGKAAAAAPAPKVAPPAKAAAPAKEAKAAAKPAAKVAAKVATKAAPMKAAPKVAAKKPEPKKKK